MKLKDKNKMELSGIELSEEMLFYGSYFKMKELIKLAGKCIEEVKGSNNARLIILETWLFIDFCIREILMSGLNLNRVNVDACDLRLHLLPKSFRECIKLIEKLKEIHSGLLQDPQEKGVRLPLHFLFFIQKQYPDFFNQLLDIEQKYYNKYVPELVTKNYNPLEVETTPVKVQYSQIPKEWIRAVGRIDQTWIKSVNRLSEARNYAAHSYDSKKILRRMGYSGINAVAHLKDECLKLLRNLIGISKIIEKDEKSHH